MKHGISGAAIVASLGWMSCNPAVAQNSSVFHLQPNPPFADCFEQTPGVAPIATVKVTRGTDRDQLSLVVTGLKPNLSFDLFTVERSNLHPNGTPVVNFKGFGLAWYQSDLHADENGTAKIVLHTILIDQIFGFDADAGIALPPTNTFHLGFWFNNPVRAAACGFDVTHPTPFNGEHKAGPLAMISVPDRTTHLGPLCLRPDTSTTPATCHP